MADMIPPEPQSADYDDRTTAAVKSVLIEIGQILGSSMNRSTLPPDSLASCNLFKYTLRVWL
jgi:hypothetical protein